jgi:sulfoxide reductase heme-binding subunit YedZ
MPFLRERSGRWSPVKIAAFAGAVLPALWIAFQAVSGDLGARPVTEAIHQSGDWTLRLLLITLAVTPAQRVLNFPRLALARRTLGVGCAAYAVLHISLYVLDQHFDLIKVASEIVLRIYLTIGALALTGLIALAATSTDAAVRRLGAQRWNALHRCVYAIAPLAAVHFFIQSKLNIYEPTLMAGFLVWLLGYRILCRRNGEVTPLELVLLACAVAVITAVGEAALGLPSPEPDGGVTGPRAGGCAPGPLDRIQYPARRSLWPPWFSVVARFDVGGACACEPGGDSDFSVAGGTRCTHH